MKEKRLITLHGTTMFIKFCQSFRKPLDLFFSHWYLKPRSDDEAAKSFVLRSIRSDRPKPLGQLITFTQRSIETFTVHVVFFIASTLPLDEISKFLDISAQEKFMKV